MDGDIHMSACPPAGNMRLGFIYVIIMYIIPLCALCALDTRRGRAEADEFARRYPEAAAHDSADIEIAHFPELSPAEVEGGDRAELIKK